MSKFDFFGMHTTDQDPAFSKIEYLPEELFEGRASFVVNKCLCDQSDVESTLLHPYAEFNIFSKVRELKSAGPFEHCSGKTHVIASGLKPT